MTTIKATWKNGQVVLDGVADWPEGRRLVVLEEPAVEIEFMTEDEQRDDPVSIQRWIDELRAIPPLEESPEEENERLAWEKRMKAFNLEAVRDQLHRGIP